MTQRNPPTVHAKRIGPTLVPDRSRALMRPFRPTTEDIARRTVRQVMALSEAEVARVLGGVLKEFGDRHQNFSHNRFTHVSESHGQSSCLSGLNRLRKGQ